jgi:diguanylate cyclase (GGDEF)-like protein
MPAMQENFALSLLRELNVAVLLRNAPETYAVYGTPPSFYQDLFPSDDPQTPCAAPWKHSSMMEYFMQEAEDFFRQESSGKIHSGIWQEGSLNGTNDALVATAAYVDGAQVLLIRCLGNDFVDRVSILQKARDNLLEQRKLRKDLVFYQQKSTLDTLTSLYNRGTFMELFSLQLHGQLRQGFDIALLMFDVDDFKQVNDIYGHQAGDIVLQTIGRILLSSIRKVDIAGRYGGEEFIVFAPYTSITQAGILADKLRRNIEKHVFPDIRPVTVSIGCTACRPGDAIDAIINRADAALYEAKRSGKNVVRFR